MRGLLRAFVLASFLVVLCLVPLALALLNATSSQAEIMEEEMAPSGTMLIYVPKDDEDQRTYVIDGYTLRLSPHSHGNGERTVMLEVRAPRGETAKLYGQVGFKVPSAGFAVGKLDPKSATNQVIFTSYSGGLHCCTKITVLELVEGSWRKVQLGHWDGDPLSEFPADVDGDGTPDFVLKDDRFDYAFAPYTDSYKPLRIFNLESARVVEVGRDARYDAVYEAEMNRLHPACVKGKNAACAAFVASASRLGKREWAWEVMLAHYRRATDWGFPTKCRVQKVNDVCPPGKSEQFREFPDALAWFLTDTGYAKH